MSIFPLYEQDDTQKAGYKNSLTFSSFEYLEYSWKPEGFSPGPFKVDSWGVVPPFTLDDGTEEAVVSIGQSSELVRDKVLECWLCGLHYLHTT